MRDKISPHCTSPSSTGPASGLPGALRALLLATAVWLTVCVILLLALSNEAERSGQKSVSLVALFWASLPVYPPYILLSWGFYLHARRWPVYWSNLRQLLRTFVFSMLIFNGLWMPYINSLELLQLGKPTSLLWQAVLQQNWFYRFYDFVLAGSAFGVQAVLAVMGKAQSREQAWRREQADNLRLRLLLLQGQLEPHFLFNALNSISALVRAADRGLALSALARISELLRYALRASKTEWVSVQDELNFVHDYLELQRLRYGDSLSVHWHVCEAAWDGVACPPLIFQPLVENAIRHGLEACDGEGFVVLSLAPDAAGLRLTLRNPVGASPQGQRGHGLGLAATRERLQILYGDAARLIAMPHDANFMTELILPWRELHD
jgi:two-component system sensor histidine kinase AlgZ